MNYYVDSNKEFKYSAGAYALEFKGIVKSENPKSWIGTIIVLTNIDDYSPKEVLIKIRGVYTSNPIKVLVEIESTMDLEVFSDSQYEELRKILSEVIIRKDITITDKYYAD